jgi:hypothetical protein
MQSFCCKFFLILLTALVAEADRTQASQNEDSCVAMMNITPDQFNPLLLHFEFTGNVPVNSFQFLGIWDFGDGNLSSDSCPSHLYSQPGTYTVCLSFSICIGGGLSCHDDTCVTITIGNIAGVGNPDGSLTAFYSYPNPVHSKLHIRTDSSRDFAVKIKTMTGQVVFDGTLINDEPIDVSFFPDGIYFIEASDGSSIIERKFMVHR